MINITKEFTCPTGEIRSSVHCNHSLFLILPKEFAVHKKIFLLSKNYGGILRKSACGWGHLSGTFSLLCKKTVSAEVKKNYRSGNGKQDELQKYVIMPFLCNINYMKA